MEKKTLQIYFTSDIHGFIFPTDYRGEGEKDTGLFKCANRFRKDGNTLILDGGDILQGSPLGAFQHDDLGNAAQFARMMNACGYDYVTLGNHDFNFGQDYLKTYLDELEAVCVCQNVEREDGSLPYPWRLHTLENGLQVGIVGIATDYINVWEKPENLAGVRVTDPLPAVRQALAEMKEKADLTICIYHGGFERDLSDGTVLSTTTENIGYRICQELDFDLLLTGHQHMSVPGQMVCGTYVVQPAENGREFHTIRVETEGEGFHITSERLPAGGACDPALLERFADMERGAQTWLDKVVGHLSRSLTTDTPLNMAAEYSPLAAFFNQVQLAASGAQLSSTSLANEVNGMPKTVRRRDVLTAYPYTNTMTVLEITGAQLRRAMERSAEYFALDGEGNLKVSDTFLKPKVEHYNYDYYAGVDYAYDLRMPLGSRVVKLERDGRPVLDTDRFTICVNSYRASGAGGYPCYPECAVVKESDTEMSDLILAYFQAKPEVSVGEETPMQLIF